MKNINSFFLLAVFPILFPTAVFGDSAREVPTPGGAETATSTPTPAGADEAKDRAKELWERGKTFAAKGMTKRAQEFFDEAQRLNLQVGESQGSTVTREQVMKENAILADYQVNPENQFDDVIKTLFDTAVADYRKGDYEHALANLNRALDTNSANARVLALKELIQNKMGIHDEDTEAPTPTPEETPEAAAPKKHKKRRKEVPAQTPTPSYSDSDAQAKSDDAFNLGKKSYENNNFAEAKKFFDEALQYEPTNQQAQLALNHLLMEHPELKDAP